MAFISTYSALENEQNSEFNRQPYLWVLAASIHALNLSGRIGCSATPMTDTEIAPRGNALWRRLFT